jgi:hypothetical protein
LKKRGRNIPPLDLFKTFYSLSIEMFEPAKKADKVVGTSISGTEIEPSAVKVIV